MSFDKGIPFNGFDSVLEMLRQADAGFRRKILLNLEKRDPQLARRIAAELAAWANATEDSSWETLERSQNRAFARNYGH